MNKITELNQKGKDLQHRVAKLAEEDGVWRTVRGRRVFIKEGQSFDDALKQSLSKSGKGSGGGKPVGPSYVVGGYRGTLQSVKGHLIHVRTGEDLDTALKRDMESRKFVPAASSPSGKVSASPDARRLLSAMGSDNNITFLPSDKQMRALHEGIAAVQKSGLKLTPKVINDLTAGEETERNTQYGKYPGYKKLNRVLGDIFNGAKTK